MDYLPSAPPLALPEVNAVESLASLAAPIEPVQASSPTLAAYDIFSKHPTLYALAVVDERRKPIGILNRFKFLEALSKPFGRDLLTQKPVPR